MSDPGLAQAVHAVRSFSRFYTRRIGVLQEGLLGSPFSLTEGRLIYEMAQRDRTTAAELATDLTLDPGYLSRILRGFEQKGLIERRVSEEDGRQQLLSLTAAGKSAFAEIDSRSRDDIAAMLRPLPPAERSRLVDAVRTAERLLDGPAEHRAPYRLRPHRPGDIGWVISKHGALYHHEYGWDESFEALVAEVAAEFIRNFDPARERCWIAERHGEPVGSVFLARKSDETAKLRLLIVDPSARGLGIGGRLVEECIGFARQAGYRKITLWTNSVLLAARAIYRKRGFRLVHEEPHRSFGQDLIGETWELDL